MNRGIIESELLKERNHFKSEKGILEEVSRILSDNEHTRALIKQTLQEKSSTDSNNFNSDLLQTDKIYHITQIRKVCISYRLRFLDSSSFKSGIPEEAISKINALEKQHNTKLRGFKIMAPSKAFELKNADDPLLFAPIGNDYYYLIHQWGNEINPLRKWLVKPFKNLMTFTWFCLLISLIITLLTPESNLSKSVPAAKIIVFLFAFKSVIAVLMYAFFMMGKNFNNAIWARPYYNN